MAVIHKTTMKPTKLELLAPWLPLQPWYVGAGPRAGAVQGRGLPARRSAGRGGDRVHGGPGRFRGASVHYHLPLSYRGAPLDGAEQGLIGTSDTGVLGQRWVYDGAHDPALFVAQSAALLQGRAEPQMQSESDAPYSSVYRPVGRRPGRGGRRVRHQRAGRHPPRRGELTFDVTRVLDPARQAPLRRGGMSPPRGGCRTVARAAACSP